MEAALADTVPATTSLGRPGEASSRRAPLDTTAGPALLLSAVALGCALQVNFGQYHPSALLWVTVAISTYVVALAAPGLRIFRVLNRNASWVLCTALCLQFILLLTRSPGATGTLAGTGTDLWPFRAGVVAAGGLIAASAWAPRRISRACLVAMLLLHASLGVWVLRAAPNPGVDVVAFQQDASQALLDGKNPYSLTFPDPYANPTGFYGEGVVREGRLAFGYPYPPLSLLMALPGHVLGDVRYAQLAAMTLAGALIIFARPGNLPVLAGAFLLFTPRGFFVLEAGWTEPFAVLLLAATVFVAYRWRGSVAWPLGLLVAVKQYLVFGLLLVPLLAAGIRQRPRKIVWKAVLVAAAVTLPLAAWDLTAFVHSAVMLQFRQPFRPDALSYPAALFHITGWRAPAWVGFALVVPTLILCLRKSPRTPAGYAAALGLVCFVFFAFNKQAFCNYYHFIIGALCCAAGASDRPARHHENPPRLV